MIKKELLKLVENITDEGSIDEVLSKSDFAKSLLSSGLTLEAFKTKLNTDDGFKSFIDSEKDKHYNKALETWKTNNLQKLIDEEIKKKFPSKDPKDTALEDMKKQLEDMQKAALRKDLVNDAIKQMTEKKLPLELVDFIVGADADSTKSNLETLTSIFEKHNEVVKTEILKNNSYTPPGGASGEKAGSFGMKMAQQKTNVNVDLEKARDSYFK